MCKILHIKNESDLEDIDFASMEIGDKIACQSLQCMKSHIAKEVYRLANEYCMNFEVTQDSPRPQYSIEHDGNLNTEIARIR